MFIDLSMSHKSGQKEKEREREREKTNKIFFIYRFFFMQFAFVQAIITVSWLLCRLR